MKQRYIDLFPKTFFVFIALQSLLDLLTSLSIVKIPLPVSPGVIVRFLFLLLGIIYIILQYKKNSNKFMYLFTITWSVFILIKIFIDGFIFDTSAFSQEILNMVKISYGILLIPISSVVGSECNSKEELINKYSKAVQISVGLIVVVMILSLLTHTSMNSYGYGKAGLKGWFYAANELGASLAISMPIVLIRLFDSSKLSQAVIWVIVFGGFFSLLMIGTKVGYLATVLVLAIFVFYLGTKLIIDYSVLGLIRLLISVALLLGVFAASDSLTAVSNTAEHYDAVTKKRINPDSKEKIDSGDEKNQDDEKNQIDNVLLSGRNIFLGQRFTAFNKAPLIQKIIGSTYKGMGKKLLYAGRYIEMDFFDIFFETGILGFILYFIPVIYCFLKLFKTVLHRWQIILMPQVLLLLLSTLLGLGISFVAGHVLTAPAVSIFLMLNLTWLGIFTPDNKVDYLLNIKLKR